MKSGLRSIILLIVALTCICHRAEAQGLQLPSATPNTLKVEGITYAFYSDAKIDGSIDYGLKVNFQVSSDVLMRNGLKPPRPVSESYLVLQYDAGTLHLNLDNWIGSRLLTPQGGLNPAALHIDTAMSADIPHHVRLKRTTPNSKEIPPFYVFCLVKCERTDGTPVYLYSTQPPDRLEAIDALPATPPAEQPKEFSIGAKYVPSEGLSNGVSRSVAQIPFSLYGHSLFTGQSLGRFYFLSDNLVSSENRDKYAHLNAGIGFDRFLTIQGASQKRYVDGVEAITRGLQVVRLQALAQLKTNQTFSTESAYFETSLATTLTALKGRAPGTLLYSNTGVYLTLYPIAFEHFFSRDPVDIPNHANRDSLQTSLSVHWAPIFIAAGKKPGTNHSAYLDLQARGWYFPNETALPSYYARRFEGRYDLELDLPVENGKWFIVLGYGEGAVADNGFQHASTFSVGVRLFGYTIR